MGSNSASSGADGALVPVIPSNSKSKGKGKRYEDAEDNDDEPFDDDEEWLSKGDDIGMSGLMELMLSIRTEMRQGQQKMNKRMSEGMRHIRADMKGQLKLSHAKVSAVEAKMKVLEKKVDDTNLKADKVDNMDVQLQDVIKKVGEWEKFGKGNVPLLLVLGVLIEQGKGNTRVCTLVIGGLKGKPMHEGVKWLKDSLQTAGLPAPVEVFVKDGSSDYINSILVAKFEHQQARDQALQALKDKSVGI